VCLDSRRIPIDAGNRVDGPYPYWGAGSIQDYVDGYLFDEEVVLLGEDGAPFFDRTRPVAFLIKERIWANNHIHVLKSAQGLCNEFLAYYLNSVQYHEYITGSILTKLTQTKMGNIVMILPPLPEQREIAAYLDKKCAAIDAVLAKRRKQLECLAEYRKSVIYAYVTGKKEVAA